MGDVLRAVHLSSCGAPLSGAYSILSQWVQLVLDSGTQSATTSCIQYDQDGSDPMNCGDDYYYLGLGLGLHTFHGTSVLEQKLALALNQYSISGGTWNSTECFGIYRGIRPVKALGSAIGLDSAVYAGPMFSDRPCEPPEAGDWEISEDCTVVEDVSVVANVIVLPNVSLTIANCVSLDIDSSNHSLKVKNGAKVVIRRGGKIF